MKPDYSGWHIDHLEKHAGLLRRMLLKGEKYQDVIEHLKAIDAELTQRDYALVLLVGDDLYWDYGYWRSEEDCHKHAQQMGLKVGERYPMGNKECHLEIRKRT